MIKIYRKGKYTLLSFFFFKFIYILISQHNRLVKYRRTIDRHLKGRTERSSWYIFVFYWQNQSICREVECYSYVLLGNSTLKSFKEPSPSTLSQRQLPRTLNLDYRQFLSCSPQMALMGCPLDALVIRVIYNLKKLTQYNNCSINQKS